MFLRTLSRMILHSPSKYRTVTIQEEKPNANCLKCGHAYCLEKIKGRYDRAGKPNTTCYGYKKKIKKDEV